MIHISSDWSDIDSELDRLERMPTRRMSMSLDAVLEAGFKATQVAVHVITASLKTSGKKTSKVTKVSERWEGEISYGGPSESVHNPVDYAIYEKDRGGDHDFMLPLKTIGPAFAAVIKKGLAKS